MNQRHLAEREGHKPGTDERFKANQIEVGKKGLDGVRVTPFQPDGRPGGNDFFATNRELAQAAQEARDTGSTPGKVLKDRLALTQEPTHATPVHAPPGSRIDQSVVAPQEFEKGHKVNGQAGQLKGLDPISNDPNRTVSVDRAARQALTANKIASGFKNVGKVLKPVGTATDVSQVSQAFIKDGGTVGRNTLRASSEVGFGWLGSGLGARMGGAAGGLLGPVGGVVGGAAGSTLGGVGGSAFGRWVGTLI